MATVIVKYWRGTTQYEGKAKTYKGAMRIASRNQNAYSPTFWTPEGEELIDIGGALVEERELDRHTNGPVTAYLAEVPA